MGHAVKGETMTPTTRRTFMKTAGTVACGALLPRAALSAAASPQRPNIVLLMTDDQGWGETGYVGHPALKTPNLNAMAASGLRFDRFYAAAPVCSPTRASVLTGRTNDRSGVRNHGFALRLQERTLPAALKAAGYATGHFGKWHLNGLKGPGAPILGDDSHNPGAFGFDEWLSVTNYFDRNPVMSRKGLFVDFKGDPSEIIVEEALAFIKAQASAKKPFFTVIWTGSPHSPWDASEQDRAALSALDEKAQQHYGELVAFDRSVGALRKGLRDLGVAENTLVWYCSDNGGLPNLVPGTTGGLRDFKGSLYEGGLRVPGIIEWPAVVRPRTTAYPASTMDIFPTLADLLGMPESALRQPIDGASLKPLLTADIARREKPIPFHFMGRGAWLDNTHKLVATDIRQGTFELYDLAADPAEAKDLSSAQPERLARMKADFLAWNATVEASVEGKDYPEGRVRADEPTSHGWNEDARYKPYLSEWRKRPEYSQYLRTKAKQAKE
jgi:arylsulfatase A-like enzyme